MAQPFRVFHLLQTAHNALFRAADRHGRRTIGLTSTQIAVLLTLLRSDGLAIGTIAATLAMGKSSLTGLIERMCQKGLVRRAPSPADRRITLIYLEPAGRVLANRALLETKLVNTALLRPFDDGERAVIERFLTHLRDNAEDIISGSTDRKTLRND